MSFRTSSRLWSGLVAGNIAAYSHASLVTDGVRTALQSVSQHIVHQVQLYIDTFLCHYSLRSTCAALLCPGRCVGAHDVIVAAIARCGVSRAPIADWLREGKCRQLPGQMRRWLHRPRGSSRGRTELDRPHVRQAREPRDVGPVGLL